MSPSPSQATVRPTNDGDVAALLDLMESVAAEGRWIGREAPIDREATAEQIRSAANDPTQVSLVAERDRRVVGTIGLGDDGHGHAGLWMYLAADARGAGIGTELLLAAIDRARANPSIHKVTLQVWPHNEAALALYRRHGFVVEGYLHSHWRRRNGDLWDAIVMGLLVDDPAPSGRPGRPAT